MADWPPELPPVKLRQPVTTHAAARRHLPEVPMVQLFDAESGEPLGSITEAQLQFLTDELEEESSTDQDYYLSAETVDMLEEDGADPDLIETLRRILGGEGEREIRWEMP